MPFTTDDLAARRAKKVPPADPAPKECDDVERPIRFTLRELLIAVTVVGVLLGILRAAGIFGAVFAFLATAVFTWGVYPALKRGDLRAQQAMFDFLWGVGMPLICLVFDPFVFKESDAVFPPMGLQGPRVYDRAFVAYPFVGSQMLAMTVWLTIGNRAGSFAPFVGGYLASGLLFAALVGLAIVIPAAIGVFFLGIGLLGLTPLITTYSYARQCRRALADMWRSPSLGNLLPRATIGFILSIIVPLFLGLAVFVAVRGSMSLAGFLRWS